MRLFKFYFIRTMKDSFTIGYSIIFPVIIVLLMGLLRKSAFGDLITSYQYYSYTLIPFCILCEITTVAYLAQEEARKKVGERFLSAPISMKTLVVTKLFAVTTALGICHFIVFSIFTIIFHTKFWGGLFLVFFLYQTFTLFTASLGLLLGLCTKNFIIIKNFMNIPIFLFAILAGTFFPISTVSTLIKLLVNLSPLYWINRGIFLCMYDNKYTILLLCIACNLLACAFLIAITVVRFRKEAFLYGDSFSYEK